MVTHRMSNQIGGAASLTKRLEVGCHDGRASTVLVSARVSMLLVSWLIMAGWVNSTYAQRPTPPRVRSGTDPARSSRGATATSALERRIQILETNVTSLQSRVRSLEYRVRRLEPETARRPSTGGPTEIPYFPPPAPPPLGRTQGEETHELTKVLPGATQVQLVSCTTFDDELISMDDLVAANKVSFSGRLTGGNKTIMTLGLKKDAVFQAWKELTSGERVEIGNHLTPLEEFLRTCVIEVRSDDAPLQRLQFSPRELSLRILRPDVRPPRKLLPVRCEGMQLVGEENIGDWEVATVKRGCELRYMTKEGVAFEVTLRCSRDDPKAYRVFAQWKPNEELQRRIDGLQKEIETIDKKIHKIDKEERPDLEKSLRRADSITSRERIKRHIRELDNKKKDLKEQKSTLEKEKNTLEGELHKFIDVRDCRARIEAPTGAILYKIIFSR